MKRSNKHIYGGMGFLLAAIVVAGALYIGVRLGTDSSGTPTAPLMAVNASNEEASNNATDEAVGGSADQSQQSPPQESVGQNEGPPQLDGNYSTAPTAYGGCDGEGWIFSNDGTFIGPEGSDGKGTSGNWQVVNGMLQLSNVGSVDAPGNMPSSAETAIFPITIERDHIRIGNDIYYPCAGG